MISELKIHPRFSWEIVGRVFLNQPKNPIPIEYLGLEMKKAPTSTDRLQGVTLDKQSGCILVCDSRRCSVKVVSYMLHHFTDLREIEGEAMGVIAKKDHIFVTTLSRPMDRHHTSTSVVKRSSIFRV